MEGGFFIMRNKEFMKKSYRSFGDFIKTACARELSYFITECKYTTDFNNRMKQLLDELKNTKSNADFMVFFNTEGEVAIMDEELLGAYVSDRYKLELEEHYGVKNINHIIKSVINSSNKAQNDFSVVSFNIIFKIFKEIFKEIKYRKDVSDFYTEVFSIKKIDKENHPIVIADLLIVEDICRYLGIDIDLKELASKV